MFPATVFVSVASGHLTLLAVGQVLQRSLEPARIIPTHGGGEPRPAAGVEPGLLAASLAMALLLMAFGALATLGGALLLRLLSGIRIMTAISQAAAATFFILLMPAGVCRLIARIRGWDPDPDPTERN